ncbi:MAG: YdiY family protein [Gammaproteobacteria bacterium]
MRISFFLFYIVFYLLISPISHADEVILYNDDKISGNIINKTDDVLTLKTSYAGIINITWNKIKSISTDIPAHIVLNDGTKINETILANKTSSSSSIQQIAEINPPVRPNFINKGQINFGLDIERGNSEVDDYHLDSETEFRWLHDRLSFELNGDLQDSNGRSSQQNAEFLTDYDHFLNDKLFTSTSLLLEHDRFADLNLRTTLTAGMGYQIFEDRRMNLFIEGGPGYIWENFDEDDNDNFPIAFWALQFDRYLFERWGLQAFHDHRYSQSFEGVSDFIFTSSTGLRIPLANNLQATIQFNYDWDNMPSENADEDNHETLFTAGYTW